MSAYDSQRTLHMPHLISLSGAEADTSFHGPHADPIDTWKDVNAID